MKIYFKKPQSVPFSKWCDENLLAIKIEGKETFRYLVSFSPGLYFQTVDKDIVMKAGGNSIHQALIELMKLLNGYRDLLNCEDDINTQEVVNV